MKGLCWTVVFAGAWFWRVRRRSIDLVEPLTEGLLAPQFDKTFGRVSARSETFAEQEIIWVPPVSLRMLWER